MGFLGKNLKCVAFKIGAAKLEKEREPGAPTTSLNLLLTNSHVGYKYVKNKRVRSDCPWRTKEKVFILQRLMLIHVDSENTYIA